MTEIKISYNNEEYTLEELLQKLSYLEEKNKELQSKVNAYAMADAINTTYKKYEEEKIKKLIKENLNKNIDSLKEIISLREENILLKKQIDKLEEEKSAIAWMGVILASIKNNEPMDKNNE